MITTVLEAFSPLARGCQNCQATKNWKICARFPVFKSDSNHRAVHQSTQYFMVDRSKACEEREPGKLQAPVLEEGAGKRCSECESGAQRTERKPLSLTGKILPHATRQPRHFSSRNRSTCLFFFLERVALYRLFDWLPRVRILCRAANLQALCPLASGARKKGWNFFLFFLFFMFLLFCFLFGWLFFVA